MLEKRILLVEDDLELAEVMATVLREEGYLVDLAATAGQAQEHLARFSYAVVIADWRLPDGDGTLLAGRRSRHDAVHRRTGLLSSDPEGSDDPVFARALSAPRSPLASTPQCRSKSPTADTNL